MYVDTSTINQNGKSYTRHLLRESYREGGKVKHRTIANLSGCSPEEIEAIRLALRHKKDLTQVASVKESVVTRQGLSIGAVWLVCEVSRQLGIVDALGKSRDGKLALWQVIARVIDQGSRLSSVRLAGSHAACDVLNLNKFNEDDLYDNLDWLCKNQEKIEGRLFQERHKNKKPGLYLYDVTSCYVEGEQNELAAFGYNRDGKRGKKIIVIGLLCDEEGVPLSVEVFTGNTNDPKTFVPQIRKVAERFGGREVTFVGDRGMIKSRQIEELSLYGFHYITAITKPQIESLMERGVIQRELFDQELAEVHEKEGIRYIMKCNPFRAQAVRENRESKYQALCKKVEEANRYLREHLRASGDKALEKLKERCKQLRISDWVSLTVQGREIQVSRDNEALVEITKLDGCYVLKTDVSGEQAPKEVVYERYRDLALVEQAFRRSKTVQLEMRPVYVRKENRTRGHAFVVMMAYWIVKELSARWQSFNITVEDGIDELSSLCVEEIQIKGGAQYNQIPQPRESVRQLLDAARVKLPDTLPSKGIIVTTKKKLQDCRVKD
ncbi:MAG TPA: IS1634 family transposase [Candidatus Brocadiaceae bacterium]